MASVNKVIVLGHVGGDPEQTEFNGGGSIVKFSLATTKKWKTKDGEKKEKTAWHNIVVHNKALQEVVMNYVHKGSKILVEGSLDYRQWDDRETGQKRYATDIAVESFSGNILLLDKKDGGDRNSAPDDSYEEEKDY